MSNSDRKNLNLAFEPPLTETWVLDIDRTVKTR
jgi:hypothetical protein